MVQKGLKSALIVFSIFGMVSLSACSSSEQTAKRPQTSRTAKKYANIDPAFQTRWQPKSENTIPVIMNEPVKKMVHKFSTQWKSSFDKWISRIGLYGPTIEKVLREEGVPPDLIYLSMIESGFNLSAKSHASAVGPWQFIQSTGKMYGLRNDLFMDDRRDLIVATRAAARHLKDLHNEFGDWYLAFAAYNAGSGGVNRVIRKSGSRDFWKMARTRYMHPETKEYVPKILAALHIVKNYKQYGYSEKDFSMPLQYDLATVNDATDIGFLASASDTSVETMQQLNPSLVSGISRPDTETLIYLPRGKKAQFNKTYASSPANKRLSHLAHPVSSSDSLKSIATYYGIDVDTLAKANGLKSTSSLQPGQELKIPANKNLLLALASKPLSSGKSSGGGSKTVYHKVKKGETLARVAAKYGTSSSTLAKWNKLGKKSSLRAGQTLKIIKKGGSAGASVSSRPFYAAGFAGKSWTIPSAVSSGVAYAKTDTSITSSADTEVASTTYTESSAFDSEDGSIDANASGLSGVAHLIFLEDQEGGETLVADTEDESETGWKTPSDSFEQPVDITQVAAAEAASDTSFTDAEFPGFVKTAEGEQPEQVVQQAATEKTAASKPATYHTVKAGESLSLIAKKYKTTVANLQKNNGLALSTVRVGQKLKIDGATTQTANSSDKTSQPTQYHIVKSGESLGKIASKYKMSVDKLKKLNNLSQNTIRVNQKLRLNGPSSSSNEQLTSSFLVHTIRSGDTLWTISQKYSVNINDIKKWNNLSSNQLKANQKLKILAQN